MKFKETAKKLYDITIGKKTVAGAILTVAGYVLGGPVGVGLVEVGKIVLVVGLGDKTARAIINNKQKIGSAIAGLAQGVLKKRSEQ